MAGQYEWLHSNNQTKYVTLIANHLSLGNYEFARASLHQLRSENPETVVQILQSIVGEIPPEWLSSKSVPSPAHLSWLIALEMRECGQVRYDNLEEI